MQTVREQGELAASLAMLRAGGRRIALVPTMGALHDGHIALIDAARLQADHVVATIFVNPLQFGAGEDLDRYPRQEAADARRLDEAGCDLLWLPSADQIYPPGFATSISVGPLGQRWEGEARPGHFDGVATVVAKLFCAVRPDLALFGEKDFQQLAVIRRMVTDLGLGPAILGVPTIRDSDGLALSSRNAYLSKDERALAAELPRSLHRAAAEIGSGTAVGAALADAKRALVDSGFASVDYVSLVDAGSLEPLDSPAGEMRLIAAATVGTTRLIDNLEF